MIYVAGHERYVRCFPEDFSIPAVMTYAYEKSEKVPSVVLDDEKGGYEMARYLISMGHRKIGVIGGRADNIHTQKRLVGYQRALFESQVFFDPDLVCYGNWDRDSNLLYVGSDGWRGLRLSCGAWDAGGKGYFCCRFRQPGYGRIFSTFSDDNGPSAAKNGVSCSGNLTVTAGKRKRNTDR